MPWTFHRLLLATLLLFALPACFGGGGKPALFVSGSYEEAVVLARTSGKLLLVDAMASWCGPGKKMDQTTWQDSAVSDWFGANAVAFQFDVDHDAALARKFSIASMPTLIVLRDGLEIARHTGYMGSAELIEWLELFKG